MERARTFQVREADTGRVIVERAFDAETLGARLAGLLLRRALAADEALWLRANGVHTFGMRFAIDVVVLDNEGRVLRIAHRVPPNRVVWPVRGGKTTLEMAAGTAGAARLAIGIRLTRADRL